MTEWQTTYHHLTNKFEESRLTNKRSTISVHNTRDYPDRFLVTCREAGISVARLLKSTTLENAQIEALAVVKARLAALLAELT